VKTEKKIRERSRSVLGRFYCIYRLRENSLPLFRQVTGGAKTKICCQETTCRRCVLTELRTVKLGLIEVGNEAKPTKYSERKVLFRTFIFESAIRVQNIL